MKLNSPKIMGILNVTPDSFSDGGQFGGVEQAVARAREMVRAGADIIDIGGESTRPGADVIGQTEELKRVMPVVKALFEKLGDLDAEISVDTRRPEVAYAAVKAGASIWNDVTALEFDESSPDMAAKLGCKIVLMHMRGTPETMQKKPHYKNVVAEVISTLKDRMSIALKAGVKRENIILDPGIGFGKTVDHNLQILNQIEHLHEHGCAIVLGVSRKRFIGALTNTENPQDRLPGSLAAVVYARTKGAQIFRVHDVAETKQALLICDHIRSV